MPTFTSAQLVAGHLRPFQVLNNFSTKKRSLRLAKNYFLRLYNFTFAVCFLFLALASAQGQSADRDKIWTTVGSGGTVDETDVGKVFFDQSKVQMGRLIAVGSVGSRKAARISPQTQSAVIRYNVTPVDGLFATQGGIHLTLRYLAAGSRARVLAKLIEVDMDNGSETVRLTFDSRSAGLSNQFQLRSSGECNPSRRFDFRRKGLYIEATLTTSSVVNSAAAIQMIKIENATCL